MDEQLMQEDKIKKLEKEILSLQKKLERSERNRRQIEEAKDVSDTLQKQVIKDLDEQKARSTHTNEILQKKVNEAARARRAMLNIMKDLDEAKKAAEEGKLELEAKNRQLSGLIEEMPIPAAHFDPAGLILHMNKACTNLMGYTIEDIPTVEHHWELFYPDPDYREKVKAEWFSNLEISAGTGEAMPPMLLDVCAKNGETLKLISNTIQIGELAITMWTDLTERVKFEEELKNAKEEAEAATKAKSDFLANMSHEIRTPMNAIIGLAHLIQKTEMSPKQRDYIQKIYGSAHNLLGIINDILDFSKIEAGKLAMESINFDLHEVFDNLGSMIGSKAQDKGLELVFRIDTDVPNRLVGDPLRLGQILLNLANNAIKFTQEGEIAVTAELEEKGDGKAKMRFSVRDTGIGLTQKQAGNLFQAFSQADTSTTRKYGGTGLGLSISKRLSEMMGGSIGVESEYGKGSTFFFTAVLGIQEGKTRETIPAEIENLDVLIVDDNATSQEVLKEYVTDFGFRASTVDNGTEAIQLIQKRKERKEEGFDLILMDYSMPGLNGFQTTAKINELLLPDDRPKYILVTGFGRDEILSGIDAHGFAGFILKPVNQSLLFNTIMQAFGQERKDQSRRADDAYPEGFDYIRGAKLLLTEDNEINQQVALELLTSEGFFVDIADNGKISVDMVQKNDYDLVLMDLQMPVMDGYKATKTIRAMEGYAELPIIAMTADAMTGVRDSVIEVGMHDYVTKPIEPAQLWAALVKWIMPGERPLPEGYAPVNKSKNSEESEEIPELAGIDVTSGLKRVGGNQKVYRNLLCQFKDDFEDFEKKMEELLDKDDMEEAVRFAHTLKGVGANLGADGVQQKALEYEAALKQGDVNKTKLSELADLVSTIIESIEAVIGECGAPPEEKGAAGEIPPGILKEKITIAVEALSKRKPKPASQALEDLNQYGLDGEMGSRLEEAGRLLAKYKMKDALVILKNLLENLE